MRPGPFGLERYLARYEFSAPYVMCCSDCESLTVNELLAYEPGARESLGQLRLTYTQSAGDPALRAAIAALYDRIGADQVLVHTGAEEAIFNFMNVALSPGDHVIVQSPCYQSLTELPRALGCEVTRWELREGTGGWELDLERLWAALRPNTRLVVVNTPHNPTGYLLSRDQLQALTGLARERDLLLLCDEVYRYLEYDEGQRLPWAADLCERAVSVGVLSKSFGLPGLRIGWVATQDRSLLAAMAMFKDYTTICNSAPSEFLATLALRHYRPVLDRNRAIIAANLRLLDAFFSRHRDCFVWHRPRAGPVAFVRLRYRLSAEGFCERLVQDAGVLLLPGNCYEWDQPHVRVGFGRRDLELCLQQLDRHLGGSVRPGPPG